MAGEKFYAEEKGYESIKADSKVIASAKEYAIRMWQEGASQTNIEGSMDDYLKGYHDAVNKACEWLKENRKSDYIDDSGCDFGRSAELSDGFIEVFRKAMEE